jgi:hypothetical protein
MQVAYKFSDQLYANEKSGGGRGWGGVGPDGSRSFCAILVTVVVSDGDVKCRRQTKN